MTVDPRTPVLVGVGQARGGHDADTALDPIELWAEATRRAERDSGVAMLDRVDVVAAVLMGSIREPDPGAALASLLGIEPRRTILSSIGGNTPQMLVNELGAAIQAGDLDVALIGGSECLWSKPKRQAAGIEWPLRSTEPAADVRGDDRPGNDDEMGTAGLVTPVTVYPLFETAIRAARGETPDEHQRRVSELWAGFAAVAADNPSAWSNDSPSAEQIRTVSASNRIVVWPYPKLMCARIRVDLAASLLLCSYEAARAAGVADDRIVFLHAGADGHDHWLPTARWSLAESPAIAEVAGSTLDAAECSVDDVAHFDLYSCFPSAVQQAMTALGLEGAERGDERALTVTGGLTFAGGPLNNYVTHSIAAMADACRADPGSLGLTTALGWYITKHSAGLWSTSPPKSGRFTRIDPARTQAHIDALPMRTTTGPFDGDAVVEATGVSVERDGTPSVLMCTALTDDGRRVVASSTDAAVARAALDGAIEGGAAQFRALDGHTALVDLSA